MSLEVIDLELRNSETQQAFIEDSIAALTELLSLWQAKNWAFVVIANDDSYRMFTANQQKVITLLGAIRMLEQQIIDMESVNVEAIGD